MDWFSNLRTSVTGLQASRARLDCVSNNLANAESSAPSDELVFRPQRVLQREETQDSEGYRGLGTSYQVQNSELPPRLDFWPSHPDADANGMVRFPDIDVVQEMTELMAAKKAYELSVATYNEGRHIFQKTLEIGKE